MANPFSGVISPELKLLFTNAIDSLLDDNSMTIACKLVYGDTRFTNCPNCIMDLQSKKSTGVYKAGGPKPFTVGKCPYCFGDGRIRQESYDIVYMVQIWNSKQWIGYQQVQARTLLSQGWLQTLSKENTYEKIKRAKTCFMDTTLSSGIGNLRNQGFEREGEPSWLGLGQNSYVVTTWRWVG